MVSPTKTQLKLLAPCVLLSFVLSATASGQVYSIDIDQTAEGATEPGYTQLLVSTGSVTVGGVTFTTSGIAGSRDRGGENLLTRDFIFNDLNRVGVKVSGLPAAMWIAEVWSWDNLCCAGDQVAGTFDFGTTTETLYGTYPKDPDVPFSFTFDSSTLTDGFLIFARIAPGSSAGRFNALRLTQPSTMFTWNDDVSGDWNVGSHWTADGTEPGPNSARHAAIFGSAIQTAQTVFTNVPVTVNSAEFDNENSYVLDGAGSINLAANTSVGLPSITNIQGTHRFQVAVNLHDDTIVDVQSAATMIFDGALDLMGNTLTKTGSGELAIRNDLVTAGGTVFLQQGSLSGNGTISGDLENDAGTISPGNTASNLSVVPEPATLPLLLLVVILYAASKRAFMNRVD